MDHSQQQKFLSLRRKLSDLNYSETFGVDAISLVERLVNDLLSTTASYQQVQDREAKLTQDLSLAQAQLFPLRKENARLARENHQLHLDNMKLTDEKRLSSDEMSQNMNRLQDQLVELQLQAKAKDERLAIKDQQIEKLKEAYENATDPSLKRTGKVGAKKVIHLSSPLPSSAVNIPKVKPLAPSQEIAEEKEINQSLRSQLANANDAYKQLSEEVGKMKTALASREQELARSTRMMSSSSVDDAYSERERGAMSLGSRADQLAAADNANKRIIDQLNGQVDFLNEQLAKREAQAVEAAEKHHQADNIRLELNQRNKLLEKVRAENVSLTTRIRLLEKKIMEVQDSQIAESKCGHEQNADFDSIDSFNNPFVPSSEMKPPHDQQDTIRQYETVIAKLSEENNQLQRQLENHKKQLNSLSRSESFEASSTNNSRKSPRSTTSRLPITNIKRQSSTDTLVIDLNKDVEDLKKKCEVLRRTVSQKEDQINIQQNEISRLNQTLETFLSGRNKNYNESLVQELQQNLGRTEYLLAESTNARNQQDVIISSLKERVESLQSINTGAVLEKEDVQLRFNALNTESSQIKSSLQSCRKELEVCKTERTELQLRVENLSLDVQNFERKSENYYRLLTDANDKLTAKTLELNEAIRTINSLSADNSNEVISELQDSLHSCRSNVQRLQEENSRLREEKRALDRLSSSLQGTLAYGGKTGDIDSDVLQLIKEKDRNINSLKSIIEENQNEMKRLETLNNRLERALENSTNDVEDYQSREISLQNKLDEQSSEVKLLQERLLSVQSQLSSMEDDQDRNNGTINTLSDQLRSAKKDVESLTNRLRDRERHSENLDHNIKLLKGQLSTVSRRSDSNNSDVKKILVERAEYEEKNQELKLLIAHMESSAKSLSQKYNKVTIALESAEREIKNYEKKLEMANSTLTERDEKLKMLQSSLENLDREHDRIQELLDSAEDEACKRNEYSQSLERQLQQTKELLAQNEKKLKQNQTEIVNCQRANNIIQAKFNSLQVENQDLKQRLSYKHQEVGGAAEDLLLMTKENQALTSELAITTSERDAARLQLHEHMQTTAEVEQSRRALEIEKNDLLETYRTVINEKRKLESELEKMGSIRHQTSSQSQQLSMQISELQGAVKYHNNIEEKLLSEKAALVKQVEAAQDQLARSQNRIDALEADNRRMLHDSSGLRQGSAMQNDRIAMLIKRATIATDSSKKLSSQLTAAERERDAMKALLAIERQRATEMTQVAENARAQLASKEIQLQRFRTIAASSGIVPPQTPERGNGGKISSPSAQVYDAAANETTESAEASIAEEEN